MDLICDSETRSNSGVCCSFFETSSSKFPLEREACGNPGGGALRTSMRK